MSQKILYIVAAVLLDGLAGLAGGVLPAEFVHRNLGALLAFAAGTLTGAAFLDLLPEALHSTAAAPHEVMIACGAGFVAFYIVESFLGSHAAGQSGHKHATIGPMILVGDALHNATDGMAIAAAFMADTTAGVATTLAVIVHELPQEIGDYAILVAHGYSRRRALFWLALVQLSALVGAFLTLGAASLAVAAAPLLLAMSAGGFVYIAAADLLPQLHREKSNSPIVKLVSFGAGLGLIALVHGFVH